MKNIITKIRKELKASVDKRYKEGAERFFNEPVTFLGVRTPIVRKIGREFWHQIKTKEKEEIFELCNLLLQEPYNEGSTIAFAWARNLRDKFTKKDWQMFEGWLEKYVDNWGKCDDFCTHAFGDLLLKYPELVPKTKAWAKSKNRWLRRASAVILIFPIRKDKRFLKDVFAVSDVLLQDTDDLVQKGYGWTLKEAANIYEPQVFKYVMKNKEKMPRTALRYAIEKMPEEMRKRAMERT
jgi:3-methyladenine DNA glycosylase AlkD